MTKLTLIADVTVAEDVVGAGVEGAGVGVLALTVGSTGAHAGSAWNAHTSTRVAVVPILTSEIGMQVKVFFTQF